jgi:hypothetical protein
MDTEQQARLDQIVEEEIRRGFRIVTVPEHLRAIMTADQRANEQLPVFDRVRFVKLTPKKRGLINTYVQTKYFEDLQSKLLSKEQVRQLCITRGEWSTDKERRMQDLNDETASMAQDLFLEGMDAPERWHQQRLTTTQRLLTLMQATAPDGQPLMNEADQLLVTDRFTRWSAWTAEKQDDYTAQYAQSQGLDEYSRERDLQYIGDHLPSLEAVDLLHEIVSLDDRMSRHLSLIIKRTELVQLQYEEATMFAETVEQRRAAAEQMARIFYLTTLVDEQDVPTGPLVSSIDVLFDFSEELIQWLQIELYMFLNSIPDAARGYLEAVGFMVAQPSNGSQAPQDELPEAENSKPDTPPLAAVPTDSLESETLTTSEKDS